MQYVPISNSFSPAINRIKNNARKLEILALDDYVDGEEEELIIKVLK